MNIRMAGIDHSGAEIDVRELFSLTKSAAVEVMRRLKNEYAVDGCVILSTCNRTELWLSGGGGDPGELLCGLKGLAPEEYRRYLTGRSGGEAVDYLFELASGLKSQVFGEDQIVTQVNAAISQAREADAAGAVLETLFRFAVTAAKKVKSTVRLTGMDASVATSMVEFLQKRFGELGGLHCLVIGNGEMGRLTASELVKAGCEVRMTVRRYHHGEAVIPEGCGRISYDERREQLPWARVVVSATTSPHYTLRREAIEAIEHPTLFCDLAVPRDIDPALAGLPSAEVCNTDQICVGQATGADAEKLRTVKAILDEYTEEFNSWYEFRNFAHIAGEISGFAAGDVVGRIEKPLRRLGLDEQDEALLTDRIGGAAGKTVGRLLFGLREHLPPLLWRECFDALQKAARGEENTSASEATGANAAEIPSATSQEAEGENATAISGVTSQEAPDANAAEIPSATTAETHETPSVTAQTRETYTPEACGATNQEAPDMSATTPTAAQDEARGDSPYFPLFVDLSRKRIALFGGGKIAARRAASIRRFCKSLTVIAPRIEPELETLDAELIYHPYRKGDCKGFDLVLAATDNREVNREIHEECMAAGIPVNVADAPEECGFYFPALAVKDNVVIGITASGTDHRLAKAAARSVREHLDMLVSERGDEANGA